MSPRFFVAAFLCVLFCGCVTNEPRLIPVTPPPEEIPVANLPESLREWNWTDRAGSGSCVHASLVYHLRWQNLLELAAWWRLAHSGGETSTTIRQYLDAAGVEYEFTLTADPAFLEWATETRRGAIIWFYDRHCVHFCGFASVGGQEFAVLCDNNRIENYIRIERSDFLRRWAGYGGFGLAVTSTPAPPPLFPAYVLEPEK